MVAASAAREGTPVTVVVRVAVVDPLALFRHGVRQALSTGYAVDFPSDVVAWSRGPHTALVLLTVLSDHDWEVLDSLGGASASCPVIAVLDGAQVASGVRALRLGARSVLSRGVDAAGLRQAVDSTVSGQAVMPAEVATALASGAAPDKHTPLSADQLSWLRQLAEGATVAQLASRTGYSERAMFRLLRALYRRMGVRTRLQAIMRAQESHWL
ncbi:DNA-binding response regulator [Actinokineospora globicatena]|uniref:HTH luxR-type domain-containing protein n=1 Tax=Actinokineospora globicatena TaxID=103729 RepID=A0A9W6QG80_9PSEU|nr:DNA-binding response regulator [Actinokineospora globicatena]GLW90406.1 hypothetical protein Aglo03_12220 [Actinokineospora globicatena]